MVYRLPLDECLGRMFIKPFQLPAFLFIALIFIFFRVRTFVACFIVFCFLLPGILVFFGRL